MAPSRGWAPIAVTVLALVAVNVASNRLVPHDLYVPFAWLAVAFLLWVGRRVDGLSWAQIGLDRRDVPSGLRWGGALAGAVLLVLLVGFLLPATHDLFLDDRVRRQSDLAVLFAFLVRVPLGTVVLEEVAFRGVLPAALAQRMALWKAVALASLAFGLWHVLPAMGLQHVNPVADDTVGALPGWVTVGTSVLATAAVGVVFSWLRYRSRSLLAPMLLHWATNSFGYLFAWLAWRG
ncbi:MAG: CPBP family intramembrane glutamic endopeptidase [Acidimicrobiales bacterium]